MQIGDHELADFACGTRLTIWMQYLDDQVFGHQVVALSVGALDGDHAQFLRAVGIDGVHSPCVLNRLSQVWRQGFTHGAHLKQARRLVAARFELAQQVLQHTGVEQQVGGLEFGHQPGQLCRGQRQ